MIRTSQYILEPPNTAPIQTTIAMVSLMTMPSMPRLGMPISTEIDFGNASEILIQCAQPFDYILTAGDCDDGDNTIYPNAAELCNGIDEDCDGIIDNDTINSLEYYEDTDGDGFGNPNVMIEGVPNTQWIHLRQLRLR